MPRLKFNAFSSGITPKIVKRIRKILIIAVKIKTTPALRRASLISPRPYRLATITAPPVAKPKPKADTALIISSKKQLNPLDHWETLKLSLNRKRQINNLENYTLQLE